ncbi:hypothetical protein BABINDRAFT_89098 [Babjeviella inositovora NRRL Y-12698]|uniref:Uncharacterized protein n=1 Tax=Babjeviella inositovora NRRL Y-12698 TaxID=984486 RepID=A0A1E3QKS2_9ASCO|nr:uncharacterized protein BABINDRAFT_89098 [Babjeviella inositovora NRRL Y-12698]ODQ78250.1 hypothetical protein BABINDRAFT_89098 [Babjeviella inositovora NRRL Y-12698]
MSSKPKEVEVVLVYCFVVLFTFPCLLFSCVKGRVVNEFRLCFNSKWVPTLCTGYPEPASVCTCRLGQ